MHRLKPACWPLLSSTERGLPPIAWWKSPLCLAGPSNRALGKTGNLSKVTGAQGARVLGHLFCLMPLQVGQAEKLEPQTQVLVAFGSWFFELGALRAFPVVDLSTHQVPVAHRVVCNETPRSWSSWCRRHW